MKKWFLMCLCVLLLLAMVACGEPAPTTDGGTAPGGNQQNPTQPGGVVDPNDPSLSAYEKEFYKHFYDGYVVSFKAEEMDMDISVNNQTEAVQLVLRIQETASSIPTPDGKVEGEFRVEYLLLFQSKLETAADGTITCKLQEHKLVMKKDEALTDELVARYLEYMKSNIGQIISQEEYDTVEALMRGEATEDCLFLYEDEYLVVTAKADGEACKDVRVDIYEDEQLEGYFLVQEDVVLQVEEYGDAKETAAFAYDGRKLYEEYSDGEMVARIDYIYDEAGVLQKIEARQDGQLLGYQEYTYHTNGKKHTEISYQDGVVVAKTEYDEKGNVLFELYYDQAGNIEHGSEFAYDANGQLLEEKRYLYGGDWSVCTYDASGNVISEVYYDANGTVLSRRENVYDEAGNRIQETSYFEDGGYEITNFDEDGNPYKKMQYNAEGQLLYGYISSYDEAGNYHYVQYEGEERTEGSHDKDGNPLTYYYYFQDELMEYQLCTYDQAGNILSLIEYSKTYSDELTLDVKQLYSYNEQDLLIRLDVYYHEESQTPDYYYIYTYDDAGNQLKSYEYQGDGCLDRWNEYAYNEAGQPTSWIHYYGEGTDRIERQEFWRYDEEGNCVFNMVYDETFEILMGFENVYDQNGKLYQVHRYETDTYSLTQYTADPTYATRHVYDREGNLQYWVEMTLDGDYVVDEQWHFPE